MKIFIALVGLLTLWSATLNSGSTTKIWVPPISDKQATILAPLTKTTDEKPSVVKLVNPEELECMSKNIYFEAALESTAGKLAVAQVTMNRVNSSRYPNTVCKVITPTSGSMWKDSREVARYVLSTPDLMDITDGATHYHADYISSPRWADPRRKTAQIDTHIFFNHARKKAKKT